MSLTAWQFRWRSCTKCLKTPHIITWFAGIVLASPLSCYRYGICDERVQLRLQRTSTLCILWIYAPFICRIANSRFPCRRSYTSFFPASLLTNCSRARLLRLCWRSTSSIATFLALSGNWTNMIFTKFEIPETVKALAANNAGNSNTKNFSCITKSCSMRLSEKRQLQKDFRQRTQGTR